MKKTACFLFGLLTLLSASAQTYSIDSMKRILRATSYADSNKVKLCVQLSTEWLKIDEDSAMSYANRAYDMAMAVNYQNGLGASRALQANMYRSQQKFDKAYELYLEALHMYTMQNNYEGMGQVYIELGQTFDKQDNFSKALIYYQQALNVYGKADLKIGKARTYLQIGLAYSKVNESEKAIENFRKATEAAQASLDRATTIECYALLCKEYGLIGNYEKAFQAASRAKNLALISGDVPSIAEATYHLGKAYSDLNNFDSAHMAYKVALSYFTQLHNKERIAKTYDGIGELYYLQNNYELATQSIKLSNQYAHDLEDKSLLQVNYSALMAISKAQGDYKMASEYFDEILALKDTIYNTEKNVSMAKMRSTYELEKKQAMIAELQQDNLDKTHQRNLFIIGFSIVMVSLIGLAFSITYIKKKNKLLQKQKVELEELNLIKDKFFSIIGHDLRSPMANILSLLQLLGQENMMSEAELKLVFEKLRTSTTSALETMDNMLAWGMHQLKASITEKREVDVQEIAQRVCRFLQQTAENKSVQIINHMTEPVKIIADKNQVEFILRNLVSNALKFSHKNGVVELWASSANNAKNIHVRDTGTGMSPEIKHKLFDQKKNASTRGTEGETGSGLGLLMSKQFINKNNGSLSVSSEQGKGSVFTVSLPQAQ